MYLCLNRFICQILVPTSQSYCENSETAHSTKHAGSPRQALALTVISHCIIMTCLSVYILH